MGHGAGGAQSRGGRVRVEVGLAGQVRGRQVRVNVARVGGAVVMEGVRGLGGDVWGDVGLLAPMASVSLGHHVLLGLHKDMTQSRDWLILLSKSITSEVGEKPKTTVRPPLSDDQIASIPG